MIHVRRTSLQVSCSRRDFTSTGMLSLFSRRQVMSNELRYPKGNSDAIHNAHLDAELADRTPDHESLPLRTGKRRTFFWGSSPQHALRHIARSPEPSSIAERQSFWCRCRGHRVRILGFRVPLSRTETRADEILPNACPCCLGCLIVTCRFERRSQTSKWHLLKTLTKK